MTTVSGRPRLKQVAADRMRAIIDRSWWSWAGPHGGLLASLAVDAAAHAQPGRPVRDVSAQFLSPLAEGDVDLVVRPLRHGGSASALTVTLGHAGQAPAMVATVLLGAGRTGPTLRSIAAPTAPDWRLCPSVELPVDLAPFLRHLEYRPATDTTLFGGAERAEFLGWLRLQDEAGLNAATLTLLLDALPPALYATVTEAIPVPTVALSVQCDDAAVASRSGWVLGRISTRSAGEGWCVDDSDLWGEAGNLLASARQTRRVLQPAA